MVFVGISSDGGAAFAGRVRGAGGDPADGVAAGAVGVGRGSGRAGDGGGHQDGVAWESRPNLIRPRGPMGAVWIANPHGCPAGGTIFRTAHEYEVYDSGPSERRDQ